MKGGTNRRTVLRTILLGGLAAGYPERLWPKSTSASESPNSTFLHHATTEDFSVCHQVRDARRFLIPPPSRSCEIAIIGGGPSGLIAGYRLRNEDVLILEKEPVVGGNARADYCKCDPYAAGSNAFYATSPAAQLYDELGLKRQSASVRRAMIVDGDIIEDLWGSGLSRLLLRSDERQLRKARAALFDVNPQKYRHQLDTMRFFGLAATLWTRGQNLV